MATKNSVITVRIPKRDKLILESLAYRQKTTPSAIVQMLIKQKTEQAYGG